MGEEKGFKKKKASAKYGERDLNRIYGEENAYYCWEKEMRERYE